MATIFEKLHSLQSTPHLPKRQGMPQWELHHVLVASSKEGCEGADGCRLTGGQCSVPSATQELASCQLPHVSDMVGAGEESCPKDALQIAPQAHMIRAGMKGRSTVSLEYVQHFTMSCFVPFDLVHILHTGTLTPKFEASILKP